MELIKVELTHCYGIKSLTYNFDLNDGKPYSIYAPNGFMKTSLARTFLDLQNSEPSKDLIFPDRITGRKIVDENDIEVQAQNIFVIEPYNENFNSEKTTLLLVNQDLKKEYDNAVSAIDKKHKELITKLKQLSGLTGRTQTPETEIKSIFNVQSDTLFQFFEDIVNQISEKERFSNITYSEVFNDKTIPFLKSGTIRNDLKDYIEKYNDLIEKSQILNKTFNHHSASSVTKSLSDNKFFDAKHSVNIFENGEKKEFTDSKKLDDRFSKEKERILTDATLLKKFDAIDKKLSNAQLRKFRDYLFDNKEILPELINYQDLQKEIWKAYFFSEKALLDDFIKTFQVSKKIIEDVVSEAKNEETRWKEVVDIFNSRFSVPFHLRVTNQENVILKEESPQIEFEFKDQADSCKLERESLLKILSQGEKRALYILNLLFEISVRKSQNLETLFIVDDIADSFDYKNKYSIVEYLRDIASFELFNLIFLTHNFDFHRTISSRIGIPRHKRLFVIKKDTSVEFVQEKYQKNPFIFWKTQLEIDPIILIASIPFVRNIAEYCGEENDFNKLTSLLHIKDNTVDLTVEDLENVYKRLLRDKSTLTLPNKNHKVIDVIKQSAEEIVQDNLEAVELEHKVVLSISIRMYAEEYMISKIADPVFCNQITQNQTYTLFERYSVDYPDESIEIAILEQVNLMTPENIHLNSFMYEPILDMSAIHLYELYGKTKNLTQQPH